MRLMWWWDGDHGDGDGEDDNDTNDNSMMMRYTYPSKGQHCEAVATPYLPEMQTWRRLTRFALQMNRETQMIIVIGL